ncbi:putative chromatin regulator PHD family [Helianthus annuus]|nr:putative chromatin regulator PHD family [Helianthus annuus]KAJ0833829.1 putative chromatin regulator PHD family [Helianthus annuus]
MFEHKHPFSLIDLWSEQLRREEESEEDEEENDDVLIANQDFQCLCSRCGEDINWYHRYYYSCCHCSDYFVHKFCAELPKRLEDVCEVGHTLDFTGYVTTNGWNCTLCGRHHKSGELCYICLRCVSYHLDVTCVNTRLQINIIHHPSHKHPLICNPKQILDMCDACGKEQKGFFYHCSICPLSKMIHSDCAFLPQKLQIQDTTDHVFSHIHHLTLAYSFPIDDQISKKWPRCRVCLKWFFDNSYLWMYKCEKCRYYTHLDCATSRNEPFMSILKSPGTGSKNYKDDEHLDLLHLPFPDPSYSLLKHLFFKENGGSSTCKTHHQHPLTLVDARCRDITIPASSRTKTISYHDPMKRIQLLCDGCVRPITSGPIYVCDNEGQCNFVLHEWCSRQPAKLIDHPAHHQHTLILHSKAPRKFFGVFCCDLCRLLCNGFAYCCMDCDNFIIDVECAFLPKEITHTFHPNHLLSRVYHEEFRGDKCRMCGHFLQRISFDCHTCNDFHLDANCALLIPEKTTNKCDKHPMSLSYFPIENHKSDYICEVCENELNPEYPFYHCHECMQSMHTACAPSILQYETYTTGWLFYVDTNAIHKFVNVKFGGRYENSKVHPHPLSFVQGIQDDGHCVRCGSSLQFQMIFKCLTCEFAVDHYCCKVLSVVKE